MTGETKQEAGFLIDGAEYPIPDVNTFNLDEDELLWEYARLPRSDFVRTNPLLDDAEEREAARRERLRHPGLIRTLVHVAYQRGNPDVKPSVVRKLVGQSTLDSLMSLVMAEDDAGPPGKEESTSTPSGPSTSSSDESDSSTKPTSDRSGNGSRNVSDEPDSQPASTGTGG